MTERILIRGVNWLGDAVMALPALERLRETRPGARITLLTAAKLADLFVGHPAVDRVLAFDKSEGTIALARRLRGQFDSALILPNSFRSASEACLARIPERVGYEGNGRSLLLTRAIPRRPEETAMHKRSLAEIRKRLADSSERETFPSAAHHLHHYLHLVDPKAQPVAPRIYVQDSERDAFRSRFSLPGKPILGLNPGAEYGPAKRWPAEHFVAAARLVSQQIDVHWLIFGGPGDLAVAETIRQALPSSQSLAGQTTLRELCVGLSLCRSVLTNDTGPMHLAAAAGARVVVPFGSTSPELTGPGLPGTGPHALIRGQAPCAPCFRRECPIDFRCMHSITPKMIADALLAS